MNFKPAPITLNYSIRRFVSENGRWELGITPVLFGVRIRAGLANNEWCVVDYCAGDNWVFAVNRFRSPPQLQALAAEILARKEKVAA